MAYLIGVRAGRGLTSCLLTNENPVLTLPFETDKRRAHHSRHYHGIPAPRVGPSAAESAGESAQSPRPSLLNPALAARVRRLAAQAEHRHAIAEFRARHAADQQARVSALLLEAIDALASLLDTPGELTHHIWATRVPSLRRNRHSSAMHRPPAGASVSIGQPSTPSHAGT